MRNGKFGVSQKAERTWNGRVYHSKLEMSYAIHLNILQKAVNFKDRPVRITEQKEFQIVLNGNPICKYYLDFEVVYGDGRTEYVDVKGVKTDIYIIKKKLVQAQYKIKITEIKKGQF